jgi:hypothetical protein
MTYHLIRLTNIDGKSQDFIFNDIVKCQKRFDEYVDKANRNQSIGTVRIDFQSDSKIHVTLMYDLIELDYYWSVEKYENLGFEN